MHRGAIEGSVRVARSTLERSFDRWIEVTMKLIVSAIVVIAVVSGTEVNASTESCRPGEIMTKECNTCFCIDGSRYVCTTMACLTGLTCRPGKSFKRYCNVCRCSGNGLAQAAACTKNVCVEGMFNEDGAPNGPLLSGSILREKRQANPTDGTCEPGKPFKHYCNNCRCGNDGLVKSAACTKMFCAEGVFNEDGSLRQPLSDPTPRDKRQADGADATCVPGTSYNYYCNTCRCGTDGLRKSAMCTRAECPESMWNEDGSLKEPQSDQTPRDKRQAEGADATCVPGTSFKWYCNTCLCGDDGLRKSAACTEIGCPVGAYNEDGTVKQPLTVRIPRDKRQADGADATCVPGKSYNYYCNTCRCGTDGLRKSAMCTRAECPESMWNEDGSLKEPRDKRQAEGADATCVPGISFKWYCNTCLCGDDGLRKSAGCTRIGCPEGVYNEDGTVKHPLTDPIRRDKRQANRPGATCVPGTSFKQYCNTCYCPDSGRSDAAACTLIGCSPGVWNEDGSLKAPLSDPIPRDKRQANGFGATCVPGTSFKLYCNTCYCPDSGQRDAAACTLIGCSPGVWNEDGSLKAPLSDPIPRDKRQANGFGATCVPGTSFKQYCNTCYCPDSGRRDAAACTLIGCSPGVWNEDGSLKAPLSDPIPRVKRQANGFGATCVPGTSFKLYCNTCYCPDSGRRDAAACTLIGCSPGVWNEDGSLKAPLSDPIPRDKRQANGFGATCVPGTSFKQYCNTCYCPDSGRRDAAACTLIGCSPGVWNEDGSLKAPLSDPIPRDKRQANGFGATCVPGTSFKQYCNTCYCPDSGRRDAAACTLIGCSPGVWNEDGSLKAPLSDPIPRVKRQANGFGATCVPGTSFKLYCNTCYCPDSGRRDAAACTLIGCSPGVWNEDGSLKAPLTDPIPRDKRQTSEAGATCVPGKSFKKYCNTCYCPDSGQRDAAACTLIGCPPGVWNEDGSLKAPLSDPIPRVKRQANGFGATCVPGTSFKLYCNTCYCPDSGRRDAAACTLIGCSPGVWNEDGSLKAPLTDPIPRDKRQTSEAGATCVPGKSFKKYCNTCYCPDSGQRDAAACTLIGCPPGVWNEDGSLKAPLSDPIPRDKRRADGPGATCVPGTSFKKYCNTCSCPDSGFRDAAVCTLRGCTAGMWNEDGTLKSPLRNPIRRSRYQTDRADATCVPGTSFKKYYTTCHHHDSGLRDSAACPSSVCPAGVWNEDGSLKAPSTDPISIGKRRTAGAGATCVPGTTFESYYVTCRCGENGLRNSAACSPVRLS